jgi:hypothetical protein
LKGVPTIVEQGFPDLVVEDWVGFAVKSGTSNDLVARLNAAINKALATPRVREAFAKLGAEPAGGTSEGYGELVSSQLVIGLKSWTPPGWAMMGTCDFKVTLLGTGTPIPSRDRFGPCTLIEAGDLKLLIDEFWSMIRSSGTSVMIKADLCEPIPDQPADIRLVVKDAGAAPPVAVDRGWSPSLAGWARNFPLLSACAIALGDFPVDHSLKM